jgi:hypothetical protein
VKGENYYVSSLRKESSQYRDSNPVEKPQFLVITYYCQRGYELARAFFLGDGLGRRRGKLVENQRVARNQKNED